MYGSTTCNTYFVTTVMLHLHHKKCTLSSASGELSTGIVGSLRCGLESLCRNTKCTHTRMHACTRAHTHTHTHTLCIGYTRVIHLQLHSDVFHFLCCPVVLLWMLEPVTHCLLLLYFVIRRQKEFSVNFLS